MTSSCCLRCPRQSGTQNSPTEAHLMQCDPAARFREACPGCGEPVSTLFPPTAEWGADWISERSNPSLPHDLQPLASPRTVRNSLCDRQPGAGLSSRPVQDLPSAIAL